MRNCIIIVSVLFTLFLSIMSVKDTCRRTDEQYVPQYHTYQQIQENNLLVVGILHNFTDYHVHHGLQKGLQYKLIEQFAKEHSLHVQFKVFETYQESIHALANHKIDVFLSDFSPLAEGKILFDYCKPFAKSKIVLLQNKQFPIVKIKNNHMNIIPHDTTITMAVTAFSVYDKEIKQLLDSLKNHQVKCKIIRTIDESEVLSYIDSSKVDIAFCSQRVVYAYLPFYQHINSNFYINDEVLHCWVVEKGNHSLRDTINVWLENFQQTKVYQSLMKKYTAYNAANTISTKGKISPYDNLFKHYAKQYQVDWRLVAAIAYRESRFNPAVEGGAGAMGLMQMVPSTAQHLGVESLATPEEQIAAGCKLVSILYKKVNAKHVDSNDVPYFVAAAYNAGFSVIEKAMDYTEKYGFSSRSWRNVKISLVVMEEEALKKHYAGSTYFRKKKHAVRYSTEVVKSYKHYCNLVDN